MAAETRFVKQRRLLAVTVAATAILALPVTTPVSAAEAGDRAAVALNDAERGHVPGYLAAGPADTAVLQCPSNQSGCRVGEHQAGT